MDFYLPITARPGFKGAGRCIPCNAGRQHWVELNAAEEGV
jgi:hypothetical protein